MQPSIDNVIYGERIYTSQRLRQKLRSEITSLKDYLQHVEDGSSADNENVAKIYRDMIKQRQRLYVALA